jgi:phosphoglycerate dehydrogenase-like enzyme
MGAVLVNVGRFGEQLLPLLAGLLGDEQIIVVSPDGLPPGGLPAGADADVLATLTVDVADMERVLLPDVRWVHVLGAGVDRFPLHVVGDRIVTCSRGASAGAIAEFVLGLMLAFEKRLPQVWLEAPPAQWNSPDGLGGTGGLGGLRHRTVGIVGLGAIGTEVARRALAFEMRVLAVRRTPTPPTVVGIEMAPTLEELLRQSDHVIVAAAAVDSTHHLINADTLAVMRSGVHLVNVARGSLVDQDALIEALDTGHIAMASLDVVDPEPLPPGHPLYAHRRVRVSPHVSWSSPDTGRRTMELFADNLRRYRAGQPLLGLVDLEAGY